MNIKKVIYRLIPRPVRNFIKKQIDRRKRPTRDVIMGIEKSIANLDFKLNLLTTYYLDTTKACPARGALREFQSADVEMLKKAVEILVAKKYTWWLAYGSVLGTIRHHGFVPWDDDLDIGMLHKDFLSLLENRKLFEDVGLRLVDWWVPGKMARIVSQYRDDVFIDIYAYENIDDWIWPLPPWEKNFYAKRPLPKDVILPCNTKYTFEGVYVNLPADPDKYLRSLYGDYMALPRKAHDVPGHYNVNSQVGFNPPSWPEGL